MNEVCRVLGTENVFTRTKLPGADSRDTRKIFVEIDQSVDVRVLVCVMTALVFLEDTMAIVRRICKSNNLDLTAITK
jgi:hypothetical protein